MEVKAGAAVDPGTGNPGGAGSTEGDIGGLLDGLIEGADDKGSTSASKPSPQSEGEAGADGQAAPGKAPPSADAPAPASIPPWKKQLKADLQAEARLDKFDGFDPLARGYLELEGKLGSAIIPPGKDATQDEWSAFYKKLGRPDSPESYSIEGIEMPEGFRKEGLDGLRKVAFDAGFSGTQFKKLMQATVEQAAALQQQQREAIDEQEAASLDLLKEEYKGRYKETMELSRRVIAACGGKPLASKIKASGLHADVDFLRFLGTVGRAMREDALVGEHGAEKKQSGMFSYPEKE